MTVSRRKFLAAAGAALAAPAIARPAFAQAQVTLKLHHFLPPVSNGHAKMLAPWAKMVEQDSGGKIKIDIFPSMQLGGTPPQLYDQARDGVVDIVWTLPGSTAGRFPSTEVFELPFIGARRGIVNARASQEFADANLAKETSDIKLLSFWSHDHGLIHANKEVKTMDDLKGLKLRSPNAARRRGAEGARRHGHPHADPAGAREPGAARDRRLRGAVGGGAGHQAGRAGEIPHRDPGLADALYGELLPGHEQGQVRRPAAGPQGGASTRTPA